MKFGGDFQSNLRSAAISKNFDYTRSVLLDEIARLIDSNPAVVSEALKSSGVKVDKVTKAKLVDLVSYNLYNNESFRNKIAGIIANHNKDSYQNADAASVASGALSTSSGSGKSFDLGLLGAIGGVVGNAMNNVFGLVKARSDRKTQEQQARNELYAKVLGEEKKNYVPIIVIGGVLLIGGVVLVLALRK